LANGRGPAAHHGYQASCEVIIPFTERTSRSHTAQKESAERVPLSAAAVTRAHRSAAYGLMQLAVPATYRQLSGYWRDI